MSKGLCYKVIVFSTVVIFIMLYSYSVFPAIPEKYRSRNPKNHKASLEETIKNMFKAAEEVVTLTKNTTAADIVNSLWTNGIIGNPTLEGLGSIRLKNNPPDPIIIISITDQNSHFNTYLKFLMSRPIESFFDPNNKILGIKHIHKFSRTWQGILLLREGFSAVNYRRNPYNWRNFREFCKRELQTRLFQIQLMEQIGKKEYQHFITEFTHLVRNQLKEDGLELGKYFPIVEGYDPEMDRFFGKALSDFERESRTEAIWLHVCFTLIESEFKNKTNEDREQYKIMLLTSLYEKKGLAAEISRKPSK